MNSKERNKLERRRLLRSRMPVPLRPFFGVYWWFARYPRMLPFVRVFGIRYAFDEKYRARCRNRMKKRRYGAGFNTSKAAKRAALIKRDGAACRSCHLWVADKMTIDHVVPIASGGTSDLTNLQLLCEPCHKIKSRREQEKADHSYGQSEINKRVLKEILAQKKHARKAAKARAVGAVQVPDAKAVR